MSLKLNLLIKEILQYPKQALGGYFNYSPMPQEASLFLTDRCNSRCSMCDFWKNHGSDDELNTLEVLNVLKQLKEMGVIVLSLSAEGEITLRKDLEQIFEYASKHFLYSLNTNMLVISDEMIDIIKKYPPYQITVGIDTINDGKYEKIRGIEGGASKVLRNIKRVQSAGYKNIAIGSVILNDNLDELIEITNFVKENNLLGIRFTAFQNSGFGKDIDQKIIESYKDDKYLEKVDLAINRFIELKKNGYPILNSFPYLKGVSDSYRIANYFPITCRTPKRRVHVYSNGNVTLCQVMGKRAFVGNVRKATIKKIWKSEIANNVRKTVRNKGCGGCWLSCYAESNLRFSSYGFMDGIKNSFKRYINMWVKK